MPGGLFRARTATTPTAVFISTQPRPTLARPYRTLALPPPLAGRR